MNKNHERLLALEQALSAHGPLAFDIEQHARFADDFRVGEGVDSYAGRFPFGGIESNVGATIQLEAVGDINADGYVRVAAIGDRKMAKGQKVAVVPIMGPVTPFPAPRWYAEFGIRVAALPNIVSAARAAANDAEVGRIVFAIHSGGGSAFGVGAAAAALREVSKVKPTTAVVNYLAASAAYWLASAAREIVSEPSGMIGSVGVRITHMEVSGALAQEGVTVTELSKPESKSDVSMYKPLTDSARAELMALIADGYDNFAADISAARRIDMVKNGDQYGRVHSAATAKSIGMIDRVATFETLLGESATADMASTRRARARLDILKRK